MVLFERLPPDADCVIDAVVDEADVAPSVAENERSNVVLCESSRRPSARRPRSMISGGAWNDHAEAVQRRSDEQRTAERIFNVAMWNEWWC